MQVQDSCLRTTLYTLGMEIGWPLCFECDKIKLKFQCGAEFD